LMNSSLIYFLDQQETKFDGNEASILA